MNELQVERCFYESTQYFDARAGEEYATLTFVLKGYARIRTAGDELQVEEENLLYIPEGERYDAIWTGRPSIEYISFRIVSQKFDTENTERYPPQIIRELSNARTRRIFGEILRLFATEKRQQKIQAMGMYYNFYAEVLPYLEALSPIRYSAALTEAMAYIEKRYAEDFQMKELAAYLSLSISRLHHLFQKELSTTPVRYRNKCRIEHAAKDLRSADTPIKQIAERNGFHDAAYFREVFKEYTGMTPIEYRDSMA